MVGADQLDANLPTQHDSSSRSREVNAEGGKRNIFIGTCTIASMDYALFFTRRIPLAGMAEKIENDVQHLIGIGRIFAHVPEGESEALDVSNALYLLTHRENVPVCGLIYDDNGFSWKEYLTRFLKERGVALISSGGHMRTLVMDTDSGQAFEFDPGRNPIRVPLQIDALNDADAREITLIPPRVEDCSVQMREILQEQLDVLRGYPGSKRYATAIDYLSIYPYYTQRILEKDYFPIDEVGAQVSVPEPEASVVLVEDAPEITIRDESESDLDATLPEIRVVGSGDEEGGNQVVVTDPQSMDEPIIITFPPETHTT